MKPLLHLSLLVALSLALHLPARADAPGSQPLPTPFPESRYQQMSAKSPFAIASAAVAPTAAPTPGFAADLYVSGVAQIGNTQYVALTEKGEKKTQIFLEVGKPNADGIKASRIIWSDVLGKGKVEVSKAGEAATLGFDEAQLQAQPEPANAAPGMPGVRVPMLPGQVPHPGFPGANMPPQPGVFPGGVPPNAMPGMNMRRRRIINSGQ